MSQRFIDASFSRERRYSLGKDVHNNIHYLSIPVSNQAVDYEEYYQITASQFDEYSSNESAALIFANACRERNHDDLLILAPGADRGVPA